MKRRNNLMRKWCHIYTRLSASISFVAMIGCIICAAIECPRGSNFDYLGLIIGILALMITFVVAWQIWQTIASREEINDAKAAAERSEEIVKQINDIEAHIKLQSETHSAYLSAANGLAFLLDNQLCKAFHLFATAIIDSLKDTNDKSRCAMGAFVNFANCMKFATDPDNINEYKEKWDSVVIRLGEIEDALRSADQENKIFQAMAKHHIEEFKTAAREKGFKI